MIGKAKDAFSQKRTGHRARNMIFGALTCLGRQTVSGMLTACGQQFIDWSAAYRLFSRERIDIDKLFEVSQREIIEKTMPCQMLFAHMDDTILRKTGKNVPGTSWRRDPLGPPFQTNFVWGQRFLQISMTITSNNRSQSRAIPVDFHHCPTKKKPKKKASEAEIKEYREAQKQLNLSKKGVERITALRKSLDTNGAMGKKLCVSVDGSYTNSTVLKELPENVTLIGRVRKDTRLHKIPDTGNKTGRRRVYGERIPTPEEIRQSDNINWQEVKGWVAGKKHVFNVKVVKGLRWEKAGGDHDLQLVIIRPLHYRLSKKSRLLYREPAYLICTDQDLNIADLLQAYLWRWDIEVNFRDEKTIFGSGKAQVRNENSVASVPAFIAAVYSFLLLATHKVFNDNPQYPKLPKPAWHKYKPNQRLATNEILGLLRSQLWAKALGCDSFTGFVDRESQRRSRKNYSSPLSSALFYMKY